MSCWYQNRKNRFIFQKQYFLAKNHGFFFISIKIIFWMIYISFVVVKYKKMSFLVTPFVKDDIDRMDVNVWTKYFLRLNIKETPNQSKTKNLAKWCYFKTSWHQSVRLMTSLKHFVMWHLPVKFQFSNICLYQNIWSIEVLKKNVKGSFKIWSKNFITRYDVRTLPKWSHILIAFAQDHRKNWSWAKANILIFKTESTFDQFFDL